MIVRWRAGSYRVGQSCQAIARIISIETGSIGFTLVVHVIILEVSLVLGQRIYPIPWKYGIPSPCSLEKIYTRQREME
jgi:hypothetical protein